MDPQLTAEQPHKFIETKEQLVQVKLRVKEIEKLELQAELLGTNRTIHKPIETEDGRGLLQESPSLEEQLLNTITKGEILQEVTHLQKCMISLTLKRKKLLYSKKLNKPIEVRELTEIEKKHLASDQQLHKPIEAEELKTMIIRDLHHQEEEGI